MESHTFLMSYCSRYRSLNSGSNEGDILYMQGMTPFNTEPTLIEEANVDIELPIQPPIEMPSFQPVAEVEVAMDENAAPKKLKSRARADENRVFMCDKPGCDYKATRKDTLSKHVLRHAGFRNFVCNEQGCGYTATQSGHLTEHMRTHNGERPFACDSPGCGYMARKKGNLVTHRRSHTGERPFACEEPGCGYTAAESGE